MLYSPPHQLNRELYIVLALLTAVTRHSTHALPVSLAPVTRSAAWCCEVYVFQVARSRQGAPMVLRSTVPTLIRHFQQAQSRPRTYNSHRMNIGTSQPIQSGAEWFLCQSTHWMERGGKSVSGEVWGWRTGGWAKLLSSFLPGRRAVCSAKRKKQKKGGSRGIAYHQ